MKHIFRFTGFLAIVFVALGLAIYTACLLPEILSEGILLNKVVFWIGFGAIAFFGLMISVLFFHYGNHISHHWCKDYGTGVVLNDIKTDNEIIKRGTIVKITAKDSKYVQFINDSSVCVVEKQNILLLSKKIKSVIFNIDLKAGENIIPAGTIGQLVQELGEDKIKVAIGEKSIVVARSSVTIK